jgi:hypothetical protein
MVETPSFEARELLAALEPLRFAGTVDNLPSGFDPDYHEAMQRRARAEFPAFFATATAHEAQIMDAAYVGAEAYRAAIQSSRPRPDHPMRHTLEIVTNNAEQLLMHVRDALRQSDAFRSLPADEQARIDGRLCP